MISRRIPGVLGILSTMTMVIVVMGKKRVSDAENALVLTNSHMIFTMLGP